MFVADVCRLSLNDSSAVALERIPYVEARVRVSTLWSAAGTWGCSRAHGRSVGGEPVHRRHVGGWFPGEDGVAVVHGAEHVSLVLNSFLVS